MLANQVNSGRREYAIGFGFVGRTVLLRFHEELFGG
tara:strand:- start:303 stop:410 length:108 start_codon:yes stop_codon:yes gene_type:complete